MKAAVITEFGRPPQYQDSSPPLSPQKAKPSSSCSPPACIPSSKP